MFKKIFLGVILLAATIFRFYHLTTISLWHDEAFSALLIRYPWHEMMYRIGLDVHPPLYYILLRFWSYIFGQSLLALRGFSAFFSIATVYAAYLFVKATFKNDWLALSAALFMAVNPFQIEYVTEARMYTFGTFVIMISAYFLVRALQLQKNFFSGNRMAKSRAWMYWLAFAISTSAAMYTHYYLFFSVLAIGLYTLYYQIKNYGRDWHKHVFFLSSYSLVLIAFLPWLKTFLFQFHQVQNNYWIPKADRWSVPTTIWKLAFGTDADINKNLTRILVILATAFSLWMIYVILRKQQEQEKWLVISALVVPFIGSLLLSLKQSIFLDRYFLFAGLFYLIALAIYFFKFKSTLLRYFLVCLFVIINIVNFFGNDRALGAVNKPGMGAAASYINGNASTNDKIFVDSSFEFFNFKYYNQTGITPLLFTGGNHLKDLPHFSGTALLNESDLLLNYNEGGQSENTVWLIWTNAFGHGDIRPTMPSSWQLITENSWPDVRPYPGTTIYVDKYLTH